MNKWWLVALLMPAVAGFVWIAYTSVTNEKAPLRPRPTQASSEVQVPQSANVPRKTAASVPSAMPSTKTIDSVIQAEPLQMKALQELLDKDPAAALVAARADLARDPEGPDAAERTWVVVKALAVLGRFDEARREAEVMVPKFRGTSWANDVERHVLAHP